MQAKHSYTKANKSKRERGRRQTQWSLEGLFGFDICFVILLREECKNVQGLSVLLGHQNSRGKDALGLGQPKEVYARFWVKVENLKRFIISISPGPLCPSL